MSIREKLSFIVDEQNEIECPLILISRSNLLTDIFKINDISYEPLSIPSFITKQLIDDVITILQDDSFAGVINSTMEYLIKIEMILDFLDIGDKSEMLLLIIYERLTTENSFRIFCLTNKVPCFHKITMKSISLMRDLLNECYSRALVFEDIEDHYVNDYSSFTIFEIEQFLSCCDKYDTVMKIIVLKNWVRRNCHWLHRERLITILENINKEASYIPRSQIKFMRNVRDQILAEIESIDVNTSDTNQ